MSLCKRLARCGVDIKTYFFLGFVVTAETIVIAVEICEHKLSWNIDGLYGYV